MRFVKKMTSQKYDITEKLEALRRAAKMHRKRIKECQAGYGVRWHLFGLQAMHQISGSNLGIDAEPKIFGDRGWQSLVPHMLSTSNSSDPRVDLFGFGPMVDDGFGVGYLIQKYRIQFVVTSRTSKQKELQRFVSLIEKSLLEMLEIVSLDG
jgi:carnitine O-acetyltransferase